MRAFVFTTYIAALKDAMVGFVAKDAMDVCCHKGTIVKENVLYGELFGYFFVPTFTCQVKIINITD
jgi:hypothetical protein